MRRKVLLFVGFLVLGSVAGACYLIFGRHSTPDIPGVPPEWTDPAMTRIVREGREAVALEPDNAAAWGELGMAFDANERPNEAIACYAAAAERAPHEARWTYLLARQLVFLGRDGDLDRARELYQDALSKEFRTPAHRIAVEISLAESYQDSGRSKEAEELFRRVYSVDSRNAPAALAVARMAVDRGDTTSAVSILLTLARNPFAQKKASAELAAIHRLLGKTKDADGFEYASSLLPSDRTWPNPFVSEIARFRRGRQVLMDEVTALESRGDYARAAEVAQKLVDLYPVPENQVLFGRALVNARDYDAAIAVLEDSILADPQSVMSHASLGMARFGKAEKSDVLGHRDEAAEFFGASIVAFDRAIELKPDYAPGYLFRARACAKLGQAAEAEKSARACISRRPEEWEAHMLLGELLVAQSRKPEAIAALETAVRLANPNETRPRAALEALRK